MPVPFFQRLAGIVGSFFQIGGLSGPGLNANGTALETKDSTNTTYANMRGADPVINNDLVTLQYFNAHSGGGGGATPSKNNKRMAASTTTADGQLACATSMTATAAGWVDVLVNGIAYEPGDAVTTGPCYFSTDGGVTALAQGSIIATALLYWNGSVAGSQLAAGTDLVSFLYSVSSGGGSSPNKNNKRMAASTTTADDQLACATGITTTPVGWVGVQVNGIGYEPGDAVKIGVPCYFSSDGGVTPLAQGAITSGALLYWVGSVATFQLTAGTDLVSFIYNA